MYQVVRVGKLRPKGQMRFVKGKSAAREKVYFMNDMRPAKKYFAAREHVNVARRAKTCFKADFFFGNLILLDQFRFMSL